jgi:transposase
LIVVKHNEPKRGFFLLPNRWVVARIFGWLGHFHRLACHYARLATTLTGWHWLASMIILLAKVGIGSQ